MGNELPPVSGTILVVDHTDQTEEDNEPTRRGGPRFPRPQYQRLETTPGSRVARGSSPPPVTDEVVDFDEAITQVNTPRPKTGDPRPTTAS